MPVLSILLALGLHASVHLSCAFSADSCLQQDEHMMILQGGMSNAPSQKVTNPALSQHQGSPQVRNASL